MYKLKTTNQNAKCLANTHRKATGDTEKNRKNKKKLVMERIMHAENHF